MKAERSVIRNHWVWIFAIAAALFFLFPSGVWAASQPSAPVTGSSNGMETPFESHGDLHVGRSGSLTAPTILDKDGKPFQLRGASTHGVQWFPEYISEDSFRTLRDDWGINTIRLALYPREGGYLQGSRDRMDAKIREGVSAAQKLGMYIILDWHVLNYNPNDDLEQAKAFFRTYAAQYASVGNVIFEICNEPVNTPWYDGSSRDLYTYEKTIAGVIRGCGSNAVILCGTNTWSQDIDEVARKPLSTAGIENVMYTFHFYAASHYDSLKNKLKTALQSGTPVFVSEFGICDASGNGSYDTNNADSWINLLNANNISFCCWSLCNKAEAASYIRSDCTKTSGWAVSDLTVTGKWYRELCRKQREKELASEGLFADVLDSSRYYYDAVYAASDAGVAKGFSASEFGWNRDVSRAQFISWLWRMDGAPYEDGALPFTDVSSGAYYRNAVLWAWKKGFTSGTSASKFSPDKTLTRGEAVTMLYCFSGEKDPGSKNAFSDVHRHDYYYDAVLWAANRGVTKGTSSSVFGPNQKCIRAEAITFLYRYDPSFGGI